MVGFIIRTHFRFFLRWLRCLSYLGGGGRVIFFFTASLNEVKYCHNGNS